MSICRPCNVLRDTRKDRNRQKHFQTQWKKRAEERRIGVNREKYILEDARKNDRKHGRENDLDADFVRGLIKDGCSYCERTDHTIMTLDRIDNAIGHLKSNVVSSCMDCNLVRGNIPYKAWLLIASAMREARRLGLLDGWSRRTRRR